MASDIRALIREIEQELAQAEYQAAQWRGLSIALVLQDLDRTERDPDEDFGAYYVRTSTLEQIQNWDIDAELLPEGEISVTLARTASGT